MKPLTSKDFILPSILLVLSVYKSDEKITVISFSVLFILFIYYLFGEKFEKYNKLINLNFKSQFHTLKIFIFRRLKMSNLK